MGILVAFIIAILMAFLLRPYKNKQSIAPLVILFVVLFMAGIASELWIIPFGPKIGEVAWLPVLLTVILAAFLFLAPPPRVAKPNESSAQPSTAINIFILIIFIVLLITIIVGVYKSKQP